MTHERWNITLQPHSSLTCKICASHARLLKDNACQRAVIVALGSLATFAGCRRDMCAYVCALSKLRSQSSTTAFSPQPLYGVPHSRDLNWDWKTCNNCNDNNTLNINGLFAHSFAHQTITFWLLQVALANGIVSNISEATSRSHNY